MKIPYMSHGVPEEITLNFNISSYFALSMLAHTLYKNVEQRWLLLQAKVIWDK